MIATINQSRGFYTAKNGNIEAKERTLEEVRISFKRLCKSQGVNEKIRFRQNCE